MLPKWVTSLALVPLFGAVAFAGLLGDRYASTSASAAGLGTPAMNTNVWTGYLKGSKEPFTLYGNSAEEIQAQVKIYDPAYDVTSIPTEIVYHEFDNGNPVDLPNIGEPPLEHNGSGFYDDFHGGDIWYNYTCGWEATADPLRSKSAAQELRNMYNAMATTGAQTCQRHWCHDTTAIYVCNWQDQELTIPFYNIGKMAEWITRLCCLDSSGRSGLLLHYTTKYSVVVGYGNCRHDAHEGPYPSGGNGGANGFCHGSNWYAGEEKEEGHPAQIE